MTALVALVICGLFIRTYWHLFPVCAVMLVVIPLIVVLPAGNFGQFMEGLQNADTMNVVGALIVTYIQYLVVASLAFALAALARRYRASKETKHG